MDRKPQLLYKFTDGKGYTRRGRPNQVLWTPGKLVKVEGKRRAHPRCCSSDVLHAYAHPLLAFLQDDGGYLHNPWKLLEVRGVPVVQECYKVGCFSMMPIRYICSCKKLKAKLIVEIRNYMYEQAAKFDDNLLDSLLYSKKKRPEGVKLLAKFLRAD